MSVVNEKLLDELKLVRASNPDWSYDQAWAAVTAKKALPCDLGAAARAVQAETPGLSFEEAWDIVEAEALPHLRKNETVGMALIRARKEKPKVWDGETQDFDQWFDDVQKRIAGRVEAIEEPWPAGKLLLIRGSEGTYV